jgi:hypothetical protein
MADLENGSKAHANGLSLVRDIEVRHSQSENVKMKTVKK